MLLPTVKFVLITYILYVISQQFGQCYDPPGTAKFPLGDEAINNDILNCDCSKLQEEDYKKFESACTKEQTGEFKDPHIACGAEQVPNDPLFTTAMLTASPELSCKRCDLQIQEDGVSVKVHCFECYDLPAVQSSNKRDIVYLAYFLEIANYTRNAQS